MNLYIFDLTISRCRVDLEVEVTEGKLDDGSLVVPKYEGDKKCIKLLPTV